VLAPDDVRHLNTAQTFTNENGQCCRPKPPSASLARCCTCGQFDKPLLKTNNGVFEYGT
jgi:hypothetical protein